MKETNARLDNALTHSLALATRLEAEGQYNVAKLLRAAVESLLRRQAYQRELGGDRDQVLGEIDQIIATLTRLDVNQPLLQALKRGAARMVGGQLPLLEETPDAYVCRTCGTVSLGSPMQKCPTCGAWAATFNKFMSVYWFNGLEPREILTQLRQAPVELVGLFAGMSEEMMNRTPPDGGWSIRQAMNHIADAQQLFNERIKRMLTEDNPILTSQAVFSWAADERQSGMTLQQIFDGYQASREETILELENMPVKAWWRTGRHEEFGTLTVRQQASYFALHELTHFPQIEALRKQLVTL